MLLHMEGMLLPSYVRGPRLTLRLWTAADADELGRAVNESLPRLQPFLPFASEEPITIEARRDLIESWNERWRRGDDSFLGIFRDGVLVGAAGLHRRSDGHRVEIGYWLRTGQTKRGFATEAARMLTEAVFEWTDVSVVAIHHDIANHASRRIPERLGFQQARVLPKEPMAPGETGSDVQWETTRLEWKGPS
jgi:ribosomal-protein-serine acetyltransferase